MIYPKIGGGALTDLVKTKEKWDASHRDDIIVFYTSPLPCSGVHGPPSGLWPGAIINAASQYPFMKNNELSFFI